MYLNHGLQMDLLESMKVFVLTVEQGSLSAAAQQQQISATMAGKHLQSLEQRLQSRLLQRTTRKQQLTAFGQDYYLRCKEILRQIDEADQSALQQQTQPSGNLRISAPVSFGSIALVPALSSFLAQYPGISLDLDLNDSVVDLLGASFDAAIRIGEIRDTGLVARALPDYRSIICAAPAYLAARGQPRHPEDLKLHACLNFSCSKSGAWQLHKQGQAYAIPIAGPLQINHGPALLNAALHGIGLIMQPEILLRADLQAGRLIAVLSDYELASRPMHLVYLQDRYRTPRLRSFIDFILTEFAS